MNSLFNNPAYAPFFEQLQILYGKMDTAYQNVADHYGFTCRGCEDNCCLTHFFHHTYSEYLYLIAGYKMLDSMLRTKIAERASDVAYRQSQASAPPKCMCPLNFQDKCILYDYRPMICRLHGIPHELWHPGQKQRLSQGEGCDVFRQCRAGKSYAPLDRTPFYVDMAKLEKEFKQTFGFANKIKKTVAEMITSIPQSGSVL